MVVGLEFADKSTSPEAWVLSRQTLLTELYLTDNYLIVYIRECQKNDDSLVNVRMNLQCCRKAFYCKKASFSSNVR